MFLCLPLSLNYFSAAAAAAAVLLEQPNHHIFGFSDTWELSRIFEIFIEMKKSNPNKVPVVKKLVEKKKGTKRKNEVGLDEVMILSVPVGF